MERREWDISIFCSVRPFRVPQLINQRFGYSAEFLWGSPDVALATLIYLFFSLWIFVPWRVLWDNYLGVFVFSFSAFLSLCAGSSLGFGVTIRSLFPPTLQYGALSVVFHIFILLFCLFDILLFYFRFREKSLIFAISILFSFSVSFGECDSSVLGTSHSLSLPISDASSSL